MVSSKVIIRNHKGIHLKPAGILCNEAIKYDSSISLKVREKTVNAKSVLGVLGACVKNGEEIELVCEGKDEEPALNALVQLVMDGLGETIEKPIEIGVVK